MCDGPREVRYVSAGESTCILCGGLNLLGEVIEILADNSMGKFLPAEVHHKADFGYFHNEFFCPEFESEVERFLCDAPPSLHIRDVLFQKVVETGFAL